ncbi:MAG: hypothetical protein JRG89_22225, partial [Deltaproteobacteria bacterium]|nr:hypothetical protein [Deltaproteobacteria bacterium]
FDTLACELFCFQFDQIPAYARFCEARGTTPKTLSHWSEIPAVPTSAFKETRLHSFDAASVVKIFRTSGTSATNRGELVLDTLALYEASLLPSLRRFVFPELDRGTRAEEKRMSLRILASDPAEAPDSSLSHMFGVALEALGDPSSGYDSRDGVLDASSLIDRLSRLGDPGGTGGNRRPIALLGTSFAFVHLLEGFDRGRHADAALSLPPGSRIMETGGFKGRSREIAPDELYRALSERLGIPETHIVNQYGMTELGSQFYDSLLYETLNAETLNATQPGPRRKLGPPWARVRLIDPESGDEAKAGATGMVVVHDLANTGSIAALQTADLGRRVSDADDGFEILGRAEGEDARGCSIAADETWFEAQR